MFLSRNAAVAQAADWEAVVYLPTILDIYGETDWFAERNTTNLYQSNVDMIKCHTSKYERSSDVNSRNWQITFYKLIQKKILQCYEDTALRKPFYPLADDFPKCTCGLCRTGQIIDENIIYTCNCKGREVEISYYSPNKDSLLAVCNASAETKRCYHERYFLLKERIKYSAANHSFSAQVEAIAPLAYRTKSFRSEARFLKPLFWAKLPQQPNYISLDDEGASTVWELIYRGIPIDSVQTKGSWSEHINDLLNDVKNRQLLATGTQQEVINSASMKEYFEPRVDTVMTYDPDTFEDKMGITGRDSSTIAIPKNITHFGIRQTLYWNDDTGAVAVNNLILSPSRPVYTNEKKLAFYNPFLHIISPILWQRDMMQLVVALVRALY